MIEKDLADQSSIALLDITLVGISLEKWTRLGNDENTSVLKELDSFILILIPGVN